jgi:hypothetical protein
MTKNNTPATAFPNACLDMTRPYMCPSGQERFEDFALASFRNAGAGQVLDLQRPDLARLDDQ